MRRRQTRGESSWPELSWDDWGETANTLHLWTQIVGKTRLALTPLENHWWNVTLYLTPRGLTSGQIACQSEHPGEHFDVEFNFIEHELRIRESTGRALALPLRAQSVAAFYAEYMAALRSLGIEPIFNLKPSEIPDAVPFPEDTVHASYDKEYAHRFWCILRAVDSLFKDFRSRYIGKSSPVHFFWGSFDLAVTRFSGRPAPPRPGADAITREAYSHEVISAGFWPGNGGFGTPAFYAYAAPEPDGLGRQTIQPVRASYSDTMKEFLLKYDDARAEEFPADAIMAFLESTYEAAAGLAGWDRKSLERR
jgi:hypothetical protein